jgi:hypothetical protein
MIKLLICIDMGIKNKIKFVYNIIDYDDIIINKN